MPTSSPLLPAVGSPTPTTPRSPPHSSSSWTVEQAREASIDGIFRKYDISRVHILERRTRNDALKTQRELRTLIRERYNDIISTTSTLQDMEQSAQRLLGHTRVLQEHCRSTDNNATQEPIMSPTPSMSTKNLIDKGVAATIMSSLIPELVWQSLNAHNLLQAAMLIILIEDIQSTSHEKKITRHISRLRTITILRMKEQLACTDLNANELARISYVARLLGVYDDWNTAMIAYLDARQQALDVVLVSNSETGNTSQSIIDVLTIVRNTWSHITSVVSYTDGDDKKSSQPLITKPDTAEYITQLAQTIRQRLDTTVYCEPRQIDSMINVVEINWLLPKQWTASRFVLNAMPKTALQQQLDSWNDRVQERLTELIPRVLTRTDDAIELVQARIDILKWLDQPASFVSWDQIRAYLPSKTLSLWDDICRNSFKTRFEAIAQQALEQISSQPDIFVRPLIEQLDQEQYTDLLSSYWRPLSLLSGAESIRKTCILSALGWTTDLLETVHELASALSSLHEAYEPAIRPMDTVTTNVITGRNLRLLAW
ncbi:hypothetical protein BDF19DRAFT_439481 [Syncephalis fuscata]|nr:hypothetical protein BDF19DRAFT_439481 [Syncephalis fuscata]